MQITIVKGEGEKQAPDIVDATLGSDLAGRQLGEATLEASTSRIIETATGPAVMYTPGVHLRVGDSEGSWDGILKSSQRIFELSEGSDNAFNASTAMRIDRPVRQENE